MMKRRLALTPEALTMMDAIGRNGSFAAAARELGRVPSALTYSVRQLEEALDVLLFDRRSGHARLTAAGQELLDEGRRLLAQIDAVANRVQRVATGWETELTVAADGIISRATLFDLVADFYGARENTRKGEAHEPVTRIRLRTEVLAGTWEALASGRADLALGVSLGPLGLSAPPDVEVRPLGEIDFLFAVAPHHPLARFEGPIPDEELVQHRAVAVADSAFKLAPLTVNLLPGQDVLTVPSNEAKLEAQLRGLGCGFVPEPQARPHLQAGRLIIKPLRREREPAKFGYAWRSNAHRGSPPGLALRWWLDRLESPTTREALLNWPGAALP